MVTTNRASFRNHLKRNHPSPAQQPQISSAYLHRVTPQSSFLKLFGLAFLTESFSREWITEEHIRTHQLPLSLPFEERLNSICRFLCTINFELGFMLI